MKIIILILLLIQNINSQQQYDIPWATLGDTPWPIHQRDPQATGRANVIGPQKGLVKWTIDVSKGIEKGPVIWFNDYVVYSDLLGTPYLYISKNGFNINEVNINAISNTSPIVIEDSSIFTFVFNNDNISGSLVRINSNLKTVSQYQLNFLPRSSSRLVPTLDSCFIFTGIERDSNSIWHYYIYKINRTGDIIWKNNYSHFLKENVSDLGVTISTNGNIFYLKGQYSNIVAARVDNGDFLWIFEVNRLPHLPRIDNEDNLYFSGVMNDSFFLFSLYPSGQIRWKHLIHHESYFSTTGPTIDYNGNIYFVAYDSIADVNGIASVDYWGNQRWFYRLNNKDRIISPLLCDSIGNVYAAPGEPLTGYTIYAISSKGELLWDLPIENNNRVLFTGAFGSDGTLYIGTCKSALHSGLTKTLMAISDDTTTSVKQEETIPQKFSLSQNYPNPFNSSTEIQYSISNVMLSPSKHDDATLRQAQSDIFVSLKIYDILGNEVVTLVNENEAAGNYSVEFNSSKINGLTSGVYFYTLRAGEFVETKKMMLMK